MGMLYILFFCYICVCVNLIFYGNNGNVKEGMIIYFFYEKLIFC